MTKQLDVLNILYLEEINRYEHREIPELLKGLQENRFKRLKLITIISRRYQVAHFFEDMLRFMIAIIKRDSDLSEAVRPRLLFAVEQNLREELGEVSEYGGPHREGRKIFLTALGIHYETWSKNLGAYDHLKDIYSSAKILIETIRAVVSQGAVEAVSALWYYENRISLDGIHGDYYILLSAFEKQFPEFKKETYREGDVLWHLASHAEHDEYHAKLAKEGLVAAIDPNREKIIKSVWVDMRQAFDTFWNDVEREL